MSTFYPPRIRSVSHMDWDSPRWFNLSAPLWMIFPPSRLRAPRPLVVCLWNVFNRHYIDGAHYWGFGLLQVGNRHLFAVMFSSVSILFIGRTP